MFGKGSFWLLCWKQRSGKTSEDAAAVSSSDGTVAQTRVVAMGRVRTLPASILKVKPTGIPVTLVVGSEKNRGLKDNSKLLA